MSKKLVYIILAALFIFGLLFLAWAWLFSGSKPGTLSGGFFGTASDTAQTGGDTTPGGNYTATLGQDGTGNNTTANGSIPLNASGAGGTNGTSTGTTGKGATLSLDGLNGQSVSQADAIRNNGNKGSGTLGANGGLNTNGGVSTGGVNTLNNGSIITVPGVVWLGGTTGTTSHGIGSTGGNNFTPADINSISSGAGGFTPTITSNTGGGNSGTSLVAALAATAVAGALTCAIPSAIASLSAAGTAASGVAAGVTIPASALTGVPVSDIATHVTTVYIAGQLTTQNARNAAVDGNKVVNCLVNVIAKTALKQITISVVNWINSGFNGQPSFVNNFQQFFTNVADLAAGQFIQGSGLAFLCSPFKLQIKVAIAQSYANRGAQSCSLTGIINNINNFMNGSFTQGGWPGLLQFTTVPTNNPYGAFAYAQVGLATAQSNAMANAKNNISPTGFLNLQQVYGCSGDNASLNGIGISGSIGTNAQAAQAAGALPNGCKTKVVTPGSLISDSLNKVNGSGVDQLGLTQDIDQIISALTTQLMTKILQNGLTSLSQGTTQTAGDLAAQQRAANLLIDMQGRVSIAQQIGTIYQGSISDIESAQSNLNNLANCWSAVASAGGSNATTATQNAATASSTLQSLNAQIDNFNTNITGLNSQIATLNQFQSQVSSASTAANVTTIATAYNAATTGFVTQADVTTSQQNRTTLQSQLAAINQSTSTSLQQCNAASH